MLTRRAFLLSSLPAVLLGSCRQPVPPLQNTYTSADALADALLRAVAARDSGRLQGMALSEQEFRDHVWPELPAARPERNMPFSYVWGDLRQKSELALSATLREFGGRTFVLRGVTFDEVTNYQTYRVHRQAVIEVADADGGARTLRLCGSMIEKDGAWKVFSFVTES